MTPPALSPYVLVPCWPVYSWTVTGSLRQVDCSLAKRDIVHSHWLATDGSGQEWVTRHPLPEQPKDPDESGPTLTSLYDEFAR